MSKSYNRTTIDTKTFFINDTIILINPDNSKKSFQMPATFNGARFNIKKNTIIEEKTKSIIPNIIIIYLVIDNSLMKNSLGSYNRIVTRSGV